MRERERRERERQIKEREREIIYIYLFGEFKWEFKLFNSLRLGIRNFLSATLYSDNPLSIKR